MKPVSLLEREAYYILIQEDKTYLSKNLLASRILTSKLNYLLVREVEFIQDYYQNLHQLRTLFMQIIPQDWIFTKNIVHVKSFLKIEYYQELVR